jgi:hypothetical protein
VGEVRAVDHVAEVTRPLDPLARLDGLASGLGVLPGESAYSNDRLLALVNHHERHLQKNLELVGDDLGSTIGQRLGAVAPLDEKPLAELGLRQKPFEPLDFPGRHQGR